LVSLNRQFHLKVYECSPYRLILEEVRRLWALADVFIATKMADSVARGRTVAEHDLLIECLTRRDMPRCMELMELHRASTTSGLPPEAPAPRTV
jgi:DNA-binding GntR family transcriptional regulator